MKALAADSTVLEGPRVEGVRGGWDGVCRQCRQVGGGSNSAAGRVTATQAQRNVGHHVSKACCYLLCHVSRGADTSSSRCSAKRAKVDMALKPQ
jgi:hypothetical protein